jgi:hypothetical protein
MRRTAAPAIAASAQAAKTPSPARSSFELCRGWSEPGLSRAPRCAMSTWENYGATAASTGEPAPARTPGVSPAARATGLNPLKVGHRPRNASQMNSGAVARFCNGENCGITPNSTAIPEAASRGPPMTPNSQRHIPSVERESCRDRLECGHHARRLGRRPVGVREPVDPGEPQLLELARQARVGVTTRACLCACARTERIVVVRKPNFRAASGRSEGYHRRPP